MKNKHLEILIKVLQATELNLAQARARDSFLNKLYPHYTTFVSNRIKVLDTFGTKNEQGNYDFEEGQREKCVDELNKLLDEKIEVKFDKNVKGIVELTTYKPAVGEAELIDEALK